MYGRANNRGTFLIVAVLVFFIQASLLASMLLMATTGMKRERLHDSRSHSRELAETAVHLALNNLQQATDGVDNDGDGEIDEGVDAMNSLLDPAILPHLEGNLGRLGTVQWTPADDLNANGRPDLFEPGTQPVPFGGGWLLAYTVFSQGDGIDNDQDGVLDEGDEAGFVTVIGIAEYRGVIAEAQVTGEFTEIFAPPNSPLWWPNAAFLSGGDLAITGNAGFFGTQADVHANRSLSLQGNCIVAGDATASDRLTASGSATVGGFEREGVPQAYIPHIDPLALIDQADYILEADGRVFSPGGQLLHDVLANGAFMGWSKLEDGWRFSGNGQSPLHVQGTFFVRGNAHIAGTGHGATVGAGGGGDTQTFTLSVIATGNIQMSGNTRLQHAHPDGLLFIAGGDIRITGTPSLDQFLEGAIGAHEQIFVAGTPEIAGTLVAQDAGNRFDLNTENAVPGTPNLTYDGGIQTKIPVIDPDNPWFRLDPELLAYEERR
ncbi:MAG: hypothetical protein ACYTHN_16090 [Planctomycetota bacterium]|jgi:hypothetical protein